MSRVCEEMSQFASTHRWLSILTLGIAVAFYGCVVWIRECCGCTKRVDETAQEILPQNSEKPISPPSLDPKRVSLPSPTTPPSSVLNTAFRLSPLGPTKPLPPQTESEDSDKDDGIPTEETKKQQLTDDYQKKKLMSLDQVQFDSLFPSAPEQREKTKKIIQDLELDVIYYLGQFFKPFHWQCLSDSQRQNFAIDKLNEENFHQVYSLDLAITEQIFKHLTIDAIYQILKYFDCTHNGYRYWRFLKEEHVLNFDYSRFPTEKGKELFRKIFESVNRIENLISRLPDHSFYKMVPFFQHVHWYWLSNDRIFRLDFKEMPLNAGIVEEMFNVNQPDRRALLPDLPMGKLELIAPYFNKEHWQLLSVKLTFQLLNKVEMNQKMFNDIFDLSFYNIDDLMAEMSPDRIQQWQRYFQRGHWQRIPKAKIPELDFDKIQLDQTSFDAMFNLDFSWHEKTKKLIEEFPSNVIYKLHVFFFDHWKYLKNEQILKLDFNELKMTQPRFNILFPLNEVDPRTVNTKVLFPQLTKPQLDALRKYISKEHLDLLPPPKRKFLEAKSTQLGSL